MVKTNLTILVCFAILGLSVAQLTLDDALNYSLSDKKCSASDQVSQDRDIILNYFKRYETSDSIRQENDILKQVRDLIAKAKDSIIKVDAGFQAQAFVQTTSSSELLMDRDGMDDIIELISVMEQTQQTDDKLALCDTIIAKINELIAFNENLISRSDYDQIPTILQQKLDSINTWLTNCKNADKPGSVKIERDTSNGSVSIDKGSNNSGSVSIDNGSSNNNGSGSGSGTVTTDNGNGSVDVNNGGGSGSGSGSGTVTTDNGNGSVDVNNGSGSGTGSGSGSGSGSGQVTTDNGNGSVDVNNGTDSGSGSGSGQVTTTGDGNGSLDISDASSGSGSSSGSGNQGSVTVDQNQGSIQVTQKQLQSVQVGNTFFIQKKKKHLRKQKVLSF